MQSASVTSSGGRKLLGVGMVTAAVMAIGLSVSSAPGGAQEPVQLACPVPPVGGMLETPVRIANAVTTEGSETTHFFSNRAYRITRCDATGRLIIDQTIALVPVPGGAALLPITVVEPSEDGHAITHNTYGDPAIPSVAELWQLSSAQALAEVLPPTPGS